MIAATGFDVTVEVLTVRSLASNEAMSSIADLYGKNDLSLICAYASSASTLRLNQIGIPVPKGQKGSEAFTEARSVNGTVVGELL